MEQLTELTKLTETEKDELIPKAIDAYSTARAENKAAWRAPIKKQQQQQ